ncbi:MAG: co-chaperone GroES [Patescibacteria group bacterium]|mgnify:CR=1 FL=1
MSKSDNSSVANIQPTAGFLFIEPEDQQTKTVSGIYLPDSAKGDKPQQGTVVAAGDDEVTATGTKKSPAKKGDKVLYKKWGGNEVKIDRKEYLFVKFEDILAVIA